jgi:hypothetical protein
MTARFRVLDVVEVEWSRQEFTRSLTRFYGTALPPDSDKERHSGTGPFLVVVVQDARPKRRPRRTGRGWAPRERERLRRAHALTASGRAAATGCTGASRRPRRHATSSCLFGRPPESWLEKTWAGGGYPSVRADPVGTHGWEDEAQLRAALQTVVAVEELPPTGGADLALAVDDVWWAEWIAGGPRARRRRARAARRGGAVPARADRPQRRR